MTMNMLKALDEARQSSGEDRVNAFGRLLTESGLSDAELEATIGLLTFAFRQRLEEKGAYSALSRCSFCHRSQREVKSPVVATEAAICDECIEIARGTLQRAQPAKKRSWF
jgi:recombinational DNA repair protein (RecF pathway)